MTLPALKALRDSHPESRIEILGYPHIAAVANKRFYADAVRSIEYAPLSRFFVRGVQLPPELREYFEGFDVILSYLYDADRIFEENLQRCGPSRILRGPAKVLPGRHAARQLAEPLRQLGIEVTDFAAKIFPAEEDHEYARQFLDRCERPILALHPGSGSERKNWPAEQWMHLLRVILHEPTSELRQGRLPSRPNSFRTILIVSGEADQTAMQQMQKSFQNNQRVRFAHQLPLPQLAAILSHCIFVGHDSGISHLAAAAGARSLVLFGPTDPKVWAPQNKDVLVLRAPGGDLTPLAVETVRQRLRDLEGE